MLRFVRALAYKDRVLQHLEALLLIYPRGRQFADDFPELRPAIRRHFDEGLSAAASAAQLATEMIRNFAGQLDPAEQAAARAAVGSRGLGDLLALAASSISRRPSRPADRVGFVVDLIGAAILVARDMSANGKLGRSEYAVFLGALDRALAPGPGDADQASHAGLLAHKFGWGESAWKVDNEPGRSRPTM